MKKPKKEETIDHNEVLDVLYRILASREFEKAYRLRQLLEHLVLKKNAGEESDLKGYNIGLDVFEKNDDFDPDSDTIVRVQMVRLRRMVEHYYLTEGKDEKIVITIPKGQYVPLYTKNENPSQKANGKSLLDGAGNVFQRLRHQIVDDPYLIGLIVLGVVFLVLLVSYLLSFLVPSAETGSRKTIMKTATFKLPTGPSIAVFPFLETSSQEKKSPLSGGLPTHLIHKLTRFKDLFVFAPSTTLGNVANNETPLVVARKLGAAYVLVGSFVHDTEKVVVSTHLLASKTGQIIWSKSYTEKLSGKTLDKIQDDITASIATSLGQPYGIINRSETSRRKKSGPDSFSAYGCVLQFYEYAQNETEQKHKTVRDCLEKSVRESPDYAQAWAALSWMYVEEYRNGFNNKPDADPPLDRALVAARKAVVLDPDDAFNHRRLAAVLISRGDIDAAQDVIQLAVSLNQNDADVIADQGWILKNAGRWEEANLYAHKAMRLNPGYPPWYLETPILYYYRNQDCKNARRNSETYHLLVPKTALREILVIISGMLCKEHNVSRHVEVLNRDYRDFLTHPRKLLRDHAIPEELFPEIIAHLREAGAAIKAK